MTSRRKIKVKTGMPPDLAPCTLPSPRASWARLAYILLC